MKFISITTCYNNPVGQTLFALGDDGVIYWYDSPNQCWWPLPSNTKTQQQTQDALRLKT